MSRDIKIMSVYHDVNGVGTVGDLYVDVSSLELIEDVYPKVSVPEYADVSDYVSSSDGKITLSRLKNESFIVRYDAYSPELSQDAFINMFNTDGCCNFLSNSFYVPIKNTFNFLCGYKDGKKLPVSYSSNIGFTIYDLKKLLEATFYHKLNKIGFGKESIDKITHDFLDPSLYVGNSTNIKGIYEKSLSESEDYRAICCLMDKYGTQRFARDSSECFLPARHAQYIKDLNLNLRAILDGKQAKLPDRSFDLLGDKILINGGEVEVFSNKRQSINTLLGLDDFYEKLKEADKFAEAPQVI